MTTVQGGNGFLFGLHTGAGIGIRFGRATLFGEARYSLLSGDWDREGFRAPILFGVRF